MWRESNRARTTAGSIRRESCRDPTPTARRTRRAAASARQLLRPGEGRLAREPVPAVGRRLAVRHTQLQGRPRAVDRRRVPAGLLRPHSSALAFGADCSPDPALGMRCADDTLCIAAPALPPASSARRCAATTATVRPTRAASRSRRPSRWRTAGIRDRDVHAGDEDRRQGLRARGRLRRRSGLRQLRRAHEPAHLPDGGPKSLGTACAAAAECRSNQCFDRDLHLPAGQNRAYCSGAVQREQRLRPRSALRAAGRRQQRHGGQSARRSRGRLLPHAVRRRRQHGVQQRCGLRRAPERLRRLRRHARPLLSQGGRARLRLHQRDGLPAGRRMQHGPALPRRLLPDVRLRRRRRRRA